MQISSEYRVFLAAQILSKPESSKYMLSVHPFKIIFANFQLHNWNYIILSPIEDQKVPSPNLPECHITLPPLAAGQVWDVLGCTHEWKQAHNFDAINPRVWWSFTSGNGDVPSFISALKFYKIKIILGFPWWSSG